MGETAPNAVLEKAIMGETAPNAVLEKAAVGYCQGYRKGYYGGTRPQRGIRKGCHWLLSRL
jgi:hypothetical protein